jgi:hypothetical protein
MTKLIVAVRSFASKRLKFITNQTQTLVGLSTTLNACSRVTVRTAQNQTTSFNEKRSLTAQQQESWGEWPATRAV